MHKRVTKVRNKYINSYVSKIFNHKKICSKQQNIHACQLSYIHKNKTKIIYNIYRHLKFKG